MAEPCCARLRPGRSPFVVQALGWYDGPTSGLARCKTCGATFQFEMLAWDGGEQDVRVHAFAPIRVDAYERVLVLCGEKADGDKITLAIRDALAATFGRSMFVVAAHLEREIVASREVDFHTLRAFIADEG